MLSEYALDIAVLALKPKVQNAKYVVRVEPASETVSDMIKYILRMTLLVSMFILIIWFITSTSGVMMKRP